MMTEERMQELEHEQPHAMRHLRISGMSSGIAPRGDEAVCAAVRALPELIAEVRRLRATPAGILAAQLDASRARVAELETSRGEWCENALAAGRASEAWRACALTAGAECARLGSELIDYKQGASVEAREADAARAENARLREALRPFSDVDGSGPAERSVSKWDPDAFRKVDAALRGPEAGACPECGELGAPVPVLGRSPRQVCPTCGGAR